MFLFSLPCFLKHATLGQQIVNQPKQPQWPIVVPSECHSNRFLVLMFRNPVLGHSVTGMLSVSRVVNGPVTFVVPLRTNGHQKHDGKCEKLSKCQNQVSTFQGRSGDLPNRCSCFCLWMMPGLDCLTKWTVVLLTKNTFILCQPSLLPVCMWLIDCEIILYR